MTVSNHFFRVIFIKWLGFVYFPLFSDSPYHHWGLPKLPSRCITAMLFH